MLLGISSKKGQAMASVSDEALDEVVRRVTEQVVSEMKGHERAFTVADLQGSLGELGKIGGDVSAWKITYDTKGSPSIEALRDVAQIGGDVSAWKITYDTKGSPEIIERIVEKA
jgi:hypothetical protein